MNYTDKQQAFGKAVDSLVAKGISLQPLITERHSVVWCEHQPALDKPSTYEAMRTAFIKAAAKNSKLPIYFSFKTVSVALAVEEAFTSYGFAVKWDSTASDDIAIAI